MLGGNGSRGEPLSRTLCGCGSCCPPAAPCDTLVILFSAQNDGIIYRQGACEVCPLTFKQVPFSPHPHFPPPPG